MSELNDSNYLKELFIDEAKPSLDRHSGGGGSSGGGMTVKEFLGIRNGVSLFASFTGTEIPEVDTSLVTNMYGAFNSCEVIETIPPMDTSNVTDMGNMFNRCFKLTSVPPMDTSNVTNMGNMFYWCKTLATVPEMDTRNVTNMSSMFYGCEKLASVPPMNTSNANTMSSMFSGCNTLATVPEMDTRNVTNMSNMFYDCKKLTSVPPMDTSNVTNMGNMFSGCSALTDIPILDMRKCTSASSMFYGAYEIRRVRLKNVKTTVAFPSTGANNSFIETDSLISIIYELRDTGSSKTLAIGSTHLANLANTYVKLIDITDEMRAEDDLIDEKLPFVVCESTDEGATLITDYVTAKNWIVK
jgi:surface protein